MNRLPPELLVDSNELGTEESTEECATPDHSTEDRLAARSCLQRFQLDRTGIRNGEFL